MNDQWQVDTRSHNKAIKDRPQKGLWTGLALMRAARPLLRHYVTGTNPRKWQ